MVHKQGEAGSFEDLEVWRQTRKVQRIVRQITKRFPKIERYRLKDQMIRASRSFARNIAAEYGRYHYQKNIHFCRISRGSLREVLNDSITAPDESNITQDELNELRREIEINNRLLNGYINYLRKAKTGEHVKDERVFTDPITNNN